MGASCGGDNAYQWPKRTCVAKPVHRLGGCSKCQVLIKAASIIYYLKLVVVSNFAA